jgi:iron complex outermembrane receptor protein
MERYNEFTYENQIDHYTQTHYQLHYSQQLNSTWQYNAALHYTKGAGYYEEFKEGESFQKYGLLPIGMGGDSLFSTDLVRRRWLDNDFYGATGSIHFAPHAKSEWTLGGAYNEYKGAHFGEVIWAQYASNGKLGDRYYEDDAVKKDGNVFLKASYQLGKFHLYGDLQYRHVVYTFLGYNRNLQQMDMTDRLHFFNPKAGLSYQISPAAQWYASYAMANKEPIRDDYTDSSEQSRPKSERLHNLEMGYKRAGSNYQLGLNVYGMYYTDQLILTGEINDVGGVVRQNVDKSYRMGVEWDGVWRPFTHFHWAATATWSRNQILNFTEYVDLEDYSDVQTFHYDRTHIAMSPEWIASNTLSYFPWKPVEIALISKFVSRQYLDNSSSRSRSIDPFFVNNLRIGYQTSYKSAKEIGLTLLINNLFNTLYSSNGYTFGNMDNQGQRVAYNYYYPQATTHFLFGLHVKF